MSTRFSCSITSYFSGSGRIRAWLIGIDGCTIPTKADQDAIPSVTTIREHPRRAATATN